MSEDKRVMRVVLPVDQIRRMDELILRGTGGFADRSEFIAEALEAFMLDLAFPLAAEDIVQGPAASPTSTEADLVQLRIPHVDRGYSLPMPNDSADEPLFGLHNKDFPSIWVLWQLSIVAAEATVPFAHAINVITQDAWNAGAVLQGAKTTGATVIKSLFPTNRAKRDAAESAFREFAIGAASIDNGSVRTAGPLFQWGVCAVEVGDSGLVIGVTDLGWELLDLMRDLGPSQPHSEAHARAFATLIAQHAPADWSCFDLVLRLTEQGAPTRNDLIDAFTNVLGLNSPNVASTYVAGYVSRCREWGLLEQKQLKGTYAITELGRSVLEGINDDSR